MKVWAKRHRDLSSHRTRIACRLHAVLCELTPGGFAGEISAAQAARLLDELEPAGAVAAARHAVACELVADLRRLDDQLRDTKQRITAAVKASKTTLTELFGVGPIVAAMIIGDVADVGRFPTATGSPPTTAPPRSRSPPESGDARCSACHGAATVGSTTPSTWPPSPRSAIATVPAAPTTTARSPKATAAKKRSARSSGASATLSTGSSASTPTGPDNTSGPGRAHGDDSVASVAGSHPEHRLFGEATPEPDTTLRPARPGPACRSRRRPQDVHEKPLDKQDSDLSRSVSVGGTHGRASWHLRRLGSNGVLCARSGPVVSGAYLSPRLRPTS